MRSKLFKFFAVALVAVMLLMPARPVAFAATEYIVDADERAAALDKFNKAVNAVKSRRPYMRMESHISLTEASTGSREAGETLNVNAKKYLAMILDACFAADAGIAQTLFNTLRDVPRMPKQIDFVQDEKRDNRVPKLGERYVSALTAKDDFLLSQQSSGGTLLHPEKEITVTRIDFPDTPLEGSEKSSLNHLFDLPSPVLDPMIVGGDPNAHDKDGLLSDIHFQEFTFTNAYAEAEYDFEGNLVRFTENIDYTFELSFYDMIRILSAYTGINWMGIAIIGIANPILQGLGKEEMDPKDALDLFTVYVTYTSYVNITSFDWQERIFGDINCDRKVDANDARSILRHSVGLEQITNQLSLAYADLDFDGIISASDARLALRTSVGLEPSMTEPPEGKTITIVILEDIIEPTAPDEPGDIMIDTDPDESEETNDPAAGIGSFASAIMEIINSFKGDENVSSDGLSGIISELDKILGGVFGKPAEPSAPKG